MSLLIHCDCSMYCCFFEVNALDLVIPYSMFFTRLDIHHLSPLLCLLECFCRRRLLTDSTALESVCIVCLHCSLIDSSRHLVHTQFSNIHYSCDYRLLQHFRIEVQLHNHTGHSINWPLTFNLYLALSFTYPRQPIVQRQWVIYRPS